MNKKYLLMGAIATLTTYFSSPLLADDQIITENFAIEKQPTRTHHNVSTNNLQETTELSTTNSTDKTVIGTLGNYKVVEGQRSPMHVAYVKKSKGSSYLIDSIILVKCKNDANCLPKTYEYLDIGSGYYKVRTKDYADWHNTMEELKNNPNVEDAYPSYDHGITPTLN